MKGLIALVGGDEFRRGCEAMDAVILEATGARRPRVSIVPTAAAAQNPAKAASNGVSYFSALGADASVVMALGPADSADPDLMAPLEHADVVYLAGGDPAHLLNTLRDSLLLDALHGALARGAVVAGSSAGAMVLGSRMRYRGWREALGVVDRVTVLPHHERADPVAVAAELAGEAPPGQTVPGHRRDERLLQRRRRLEGAGARLGHRVRGRRVAQVRRRRAAAHRRLNPRPPSRLVPVV